MEIPGICAAGNLQSQEITACHFGLGHNIISPVRTKCSGFLADKRWQSSYLADDSRKFIWRNT